MSELLNLSFSLDVFLSILKSGKVIPIFKKESKLKCSNYRTISLLSNIDKILERTMYNRLYEYLESKNFIYDLQFSVQQKHSTSHALIYLTDKIQEQLNKKKLGCGIFVEFQKAFDIVDHNLLIQKLNYYSVRVTANNWFSSYLENRTQIASIDGYSYDLDFNLCGEPHGSILGTLLFLVYINDLHYALKHCKVHFNTLIMLFLNLS